MTTNLPEEALSKRLAMEASAIPADVDTEELLMRLETIQDARRKDPVLEARYEELRDRLVAVIAERGPRYYLDAHGNKRFAYVVAPELVDVDVALLIQMHEEGEVSTALLNEVAPRKIDKDSYRRAVARKKFTNAQVAKLSRLRPGTAHVAFTDPVDEA